MDLAFFSTEGAFRDEARKWSSERSSGSDMAVWAFDLDGTLIGSVRSDVLRPHAQSLLGQLRHRGIAVVLWSAGGGDYAARRADAHGIAHHFAAFYDKGDRDRAGRYATEHFAPEHRPDVFVDDMPDDLPIGAAVIPVPQYIGGNGADTALLAVLDRLAALDA